MSALGNILSKVGIHISPKKKLAELPAPQFILLLIRLFNAMDYNFREVGRTSNQGGDIIVHMEHDVVAVQLKCNRDAPIGINDIQEAITAQTFYGCFRTMIISTLQFTKEAIDFSKVNNIVLVDKGQLKEWLSKYLKERWS